MRSDNCDDDVYILNHNGLSQIGYGDVKYSKYVLGSCMVPALVVAVDYKLGA